MNLMGKMMKQTKIEPMEPLQTNQVELKQMKLRQGGSKLRRPMRYSAPFRYYSVVFVGVYSFNGICDLEVLYTNSCDFRRVTG